MACLIPTGITRSCEMSFGGLSRIFLGNKDYITAKSNSTGTVTGFTMTSSAKFYEFQCEPESAQLLEELQAGNASKFVQQTVNFSLTNIDQTKKEILESLALAKISAIVQFQNNIYKLVGIDGIGLKATTLSFDSGTANGDFNGAQISLVGGSRGYANEVQSSALTSVLA